MLSKLITAMVSSRVILLLSVFTMFALIASQPADGLIIKDKVNFDHESGKSLAKTEVDLEDRPLSEQFVQNHILPMPEPSDHETRTKRDLFSSGKKKKCPHQYIYEGNIFKKCIKCKTYKQLNRNSKRYHKYCQSRRHT